MLRSFYKVQKQCWLRSWGATVQNDRNSCLVYKKSLCLKKLSKNKSSEENASSEEQQDNYHSKRERLNLNAEEYWFNHCQLNLLEAVGLGTALIAGLRLTYEIDELKRNSSQRKNSSCPVSRLRNAALIFINSNWSNIYSKSCSLYSLVHIQTISTVFRSYVLPPNEHKLTDINLSMVLNDDTPGVEIDGSESSTVAEPNNHKSSGCEFLNFSINRFNNIHDRSVPNSQHSHVHKSISSTFETTRNFGATKNLVSLPLLLPPSTPSSSSPAKTVNLSDDSPSTDSPVPQECVNSLSNIYEVMVWDFSNAIASNLAKKGLYKKAILIWRDILSKNPDHVKSLFNLALCYENNFWVQQDIDKAIELYEHASKLGHIEASYKLANIFKGLSKSSSSNNEDLNCFYERFIHYLSKAAQLGHREAKRDLGILKFKNGDITRAVPLLEDACANAKDKKAMHYLGLCKKFDGTCEENQQNNVTLEHSPFNTQFTQTIDQLSSPSPTSSFSSPSSSPSQSSFSFNPSKISSSYSDEGYVDNDLEHTFNDGNGNIDENYKSLALL